MSFKVGIVTTSIRDGRVGLDIAKWALDFANARKDEGVVYELVDLKDFDLPLLGATPTAEQGAAIGAWSQKMNEMDAFVFVTAEYNHAATGVFKNATDFLKPEVANKVAGFIGYGGLGGIRAIEGLRVVFGELALATVQRTVNFLLAVDFEGFTKFSPANHHADNVNGMFDQVITWGKALKTVR